MSSSLRGLAAGCALLAATLSAISLLWPDVYRDGDPWIAAVWWGNDLVTLVVVVPASLAALAAAPRSRRAELVALGTLGYFVYDYAYYLFGARLNALFPGYVLAWVLPAATLITAAGSLDLRRLAEGTTPGARSRIAAGYMALTGLGLTAAWLGQWAGIVHGAAAPPATLGEDGFRLVAAMDLSLMVPLFLVGSVLIVRRAPAGWLVAPIILTQGMLYTLVLATNAWVLGRRGLGGADELPVWGTWTALGGVALGLLLSDVRPRREREPSS